MPHNESSPIMFRIGFVVILLVFGAVIDVSSVATRATHSDSSPATLAQSVDHTKPGIDALEEENFAPLRGKRVGLITNQTGVDSRGRRTADLLEQAPGVKLVALFSPEHGIAGNVDAPVRNSTDAATKLPIYSLFGEARRPTPEMLKNVDALVFDVQDAGVRFYTY